MKSIYKLNNCVAILGSLAAILFSFQHCIRFTNASNWLVSWTLDSPYGSLAKDWIHSMISFNRLRDSASDTKIVGKKILNEKTIQKAFVIYEFASRALDE